MSDLIVSGIRTGVPLLVGWLAVLLLSIGVEVDAATQAALVTGLGNVLALVYYAAARWAEARWSWVGWLLGVPAAPTYSKEN